MSEETWDATLAESALRTRHGVTVVGLKRAGEPFTYAVPETVVRRGDELVISGLIPVVERFTALAPGRARRHPGPRGGRPSR